MTHPPAWTTLGILLAMAGSNATGVAHAAPNNAPPLGLAPTAQPTQRLASTHSVSDPAGRPENSVLEPTLAPSVAEPAPSDAEPSDKDAAAASKATGREPMKVKAVMVNIDSRTLNYDQSKDVYVATGDVRVVISEQNSELTADKVIYDQKKGLMIADGHVIITKNGERTEGSYAKIDLTRASALITDPKTMVNSLRIRSKLAMVDNQMIQLENGQITLNMNDPNTFAPQKVTIPGLDNMEGPTALVNQYKEFRQMKTLPENPGKHPVWRALNGYKDLPAKSMLSDAQIRQMEMQTLDLNPKDDSAGASNFRLKVRDITVDRGQDGYDKISLKKPTLYYKDWKIGTLTSEFSYDEFNRDIQYLGPDIGFDPAMGGLYGGPGWDMHVGQGSLRVSPLLTFGSAAVTRADKFKDTSVGPGLGLLAHYRSARSQIDLGYSTRANRPVLYGQTRVLTDNTQLQYAYNQFSPNGFLGIQRPTAIVELADARKLLEFKNFELNSYQSIGVAQDNFFPNNSSRFFVKARSAEAVTAGRFQLQLQMVNQKPLIQVGNLLRVGFRGQAFLSAYTTGDVQTILRAGPNINLNLGNRLVSNIQYWAASANGESPFVFDSYFAGSQNVVLNNLVNVNRYLAVGLQNNLNLLKDNAKNAMAVGNMAFIMVGPPEVKFLVGYDFIRQRSMFNINYRPGSRGGDDTKTNIDFDQMRIFQPVNTTNPLTPLN